MGSFNIACGVQSRRFLKLDCRLSAAQKRGLENSKILNVIS